MNTMTMHSRYDHRYTGKAPDWSVVFWALLCFNITMWGIVIPSMLFGG